MNDIDELIRLEKRRAFLQGENSVLKKVITVLESLRDDINKQNAEYSKYMCNTEQLERGFEMMKLKAIELIDNMIGENEV